MSTAVNSTHTSVPASSRVPSLSPIHSHTESGYTNGHHHHHHDSGAMPSGSANSAKKGKQKKTADPGEASNLIASKIAQLELDAAGDKEQEAEIEREVKKANREINSLTAKFDELGKIDFLQKKVTEHLAQMKRLERENKKNKTSRDLLQKQKDELSLTSSKTTSLKDKLEKLCRELQRENNRLKSENKTLQDNEKDNHTAWDTKYKQLLWQLQDYQEAKDHPPSENVDIEVEDLFKQRFKSLIEQYELRELHFHAQLRAKELEVQYHMARLDKEKKQAETQLSKSQALTQQVQTFSKTETELRNQLNIYVEKFKQVEDTLNNSNDLFLTFRKEMEEMSKKTKRLEKENMNLTRKHDLTNQNILKMAEERSRTNMEMDSLRKKSEKLTSIINQMQKQGRGAPEGMPGLVEGSVEGEYVEDDLDGTESEYGEYDEDEGEDGDGEEEGSEEYNEDTEEEHVEAPKLFGPAPPPTLPITNGVVANGIKH